LCRVVLSCYIVSCPVYVLLRTVLCWFFKKIRHDRLKHESKIMLYCTLLCPTIIFCHFLTVSFRIVLNHDRHGFRTLIISRKNKEVNWKIDFFFVYLMYQFYLFVGCTNMFTAHSFILFIYIFFLSFFLEQFWLPCLVFLLQINVVVIIRIQRCLDRLWARK
jgi:hypothetical protein